MQILAMDTSIGSCSVALWNGDKVVASFEDAEGHQSKSLILLIEKLLEDNHTNYAKLDAIATTIGPGGFTGIRVGLTAARMIGLMTSKPLIGLTTLEVMAHQSDIRGDILAVIDAYRGQYYVQRFRRMEILSSLSDALLVDTHLVSSLAHGAKKVEALPKADGVASLAYTKWQAGEREFPAAPFYIREPDAKLPKAS